MSVEAIGAILAGVAGIITAWAAVVRAKRRGNAECEKSLKAARHEAEQLAHENHQLRMHHPEDGAVDWLLIMAIFFIAASIVLAAMAASTGKPGKPGPPGPQGEPGIQGVQGERGEQGVQGIPGQRGLRGTQGVQGSSGVRGPAGPAGGPPGPAGPTGAQGPPGAQGPQGQTGVAGRMTCPSGSSPQQITINGSGGQRRILACVIG